MKRGFSGLLLVFLFASILNLKFDVQPAEVSGTINNPPVAVDLSITPSFPLTMDDLVGDYEYSDVDGDPENGSRIKWYKDIVHQPSLDDELIIPSELTSHGEEWYFTVRPSDGIDFGPLETSPSVIIINSPPTIDNYYPLTDPTISEGESQVFNVTYSDLDEDPINAQWYLDGTLIGTGDTYVFVTVLPFRFAGIYNITVVVSDGLAQVSLEWTLTVVRCVNILEVTSSDSTGDPKDIFTIGTLAYFKVVVNNTTPDPLNVFLTVNIFDSDSVTIGVASFHGPIAPGIHNVILGLPIPNNANLGEATVYVNALTDWLHLGGVPYCPEESDVFQIVAP